MSVTEPIYIAAAATQAAILTAAAAANANGGGIVKIPAGRITMTASLPCYNGVIYEGVPLQQNFPGGQTTGAGGTILVGDGTFIGMAYNETDLGVAPTVYATFVAGMLKGFGARDITFENFSYAIKIGAKYNPGMQECFFERLCAIACAQWGYWFENDMLCRYYDLSTNNCTVGQIARLGSGSTALNCGNSIWQGTIATLPPNLNSRGIVNWTRGASNLTQITSKHEGSYRTSPAEVVQAATMANASANITVTDGTKFPLDMPMSFSASVNGFTANQVYFVVSQASNVIQVANSMRGTALLATGNTAVNAKTKGFALMEFASLDAGCSFIGPKITSVDLEGDASCRLVMQDVSQGAHVDESIIGSSTCYKSIVRVNSKFGKYDVPTAGIQSDANSTFNLDFVVGASGGVSLKLGEIGIDRVNSTQARFNWNDDTYLFRQNTGRLLQASGAVAQEHLIANTFTDTSNFESGGLSWTNEANVLVLGTFKSGTGALRGLKFKQDSTNIGDYGVTSANGWTFRGTTTDITGKVTINGPTNTPGASLALFSLYSGQNTNGNSIFLLNSAVSDYGAFGKVAAGEWGWGGSTNGTTNNIMAVRFDTLGNASLGKGLNATTATDGFGYMPTSAGAPTGVPTAKTGFCPFQYDITNNKLYVYNGAWKSVTLA